MSEWFSIINFQVKKEVNKRLETYGDANNLFNFLPKNPIMRPFDPFDKRVNEGTNPFRYTFDPSYNYAALQGIRGFLGVRYILK